jgi:hypothetical protein
LSHAVLWRGSVLAMNCLGFPLGRRNNTLPFSARIGRLDTLRRQIENHNARREQCQSQNSAHDHTVEAPKP